MLSINQLESMIKNVMLDNNYFLIGCLQTAGFSKVEHYYNFSFVSVNFVEKSISQLYRRISMQDRSKLESNCFDFFPNELRMKINEATRLVRLLKTLQDEGLLNNKSNELINSNRIVEMECNKRNNDDDFDKVSNNDHEDVNDNLQLQIQNSDNEPEESVLDFAESDNSFSSSSKDAEIAYNNDILLSDLNKTQKQSKDNSTNEPSMNQPIDSNDFQTENETDTYNNVNLKDIFGSDSESESDAELDLKSSDEVYSNKMNSIKSNNGNCDEILKDYTSNITNDCVKQNQTRKINEDDNKRQFKGKNSIEHTLEIYKKEIPKYFYFELFNCSLISDKHFRLNIVMGPTCYLGFYQCLICCTKRILKFKLNERKPTYTLLKKHLIKHFKQNPDAVKQRKDASRNLKRSREMVRVMRERINVD